MLISEIFSSCEGEGIRSGYLATFIRSYGCNLRCSYCFGPNRYGKYPSVTLIDGSKLPINEVRAGDILLTLDENQKLVETTVTDIGFRNSKEYHRLVFPDTVLNVTPEHPFYVNGQWKEASKMQYGDNCYKVKAHEYEFYKLYGSSFYDELKEYSKKILELFDKLNQHGNSGSKNGNYNPDYKYRNYFKLKKAIKMGLCQDIIEQEEKLVVHHLDENKENDNIDNLVIISSKLHNKLHARGFNFNKGSLSHDYPVIHNSKNYGEKPNKIIGFREKQFVNLTCEPYNTFLIDDIYVHNCDSMYAVDEAVDLFGNKNFKQMTIQDIVNECKHIGNKKITFTGGEPLAQKDSKELVDKLLDEDFEVNIETNGAVPIKDFVYFKNRDLSKLIITMDWKSPYSGMRDKMIEENLKDLRSIDVLKFVVATKEDLDDMKNILGNNDIYCNIFVSPVFGKIEPFEIVDYLKQNNLQNIRVQLQIHKLIWDKNMRGV